MPVCSLSVHSPLNTFNANWDSWVHWHKAEGNWKTPCRLQVRVSACVSEQQIGGASISCIDIWTQFVYNLCAWEYLIMDTYKMQSTNCGLPTNTHRYTLTFIYTLVTPYSDFVLCTLLFKSTHEAAVLCSYCSWILHLIFLFHYNLFLLYLIKTRNNEATPHPLPPHPNTLTTRTDAFID